jgi:hypothetical protein
MKGPFQLNDSKRKDDGQPSPRRRLRTGLLVLGSAIFGGVAVVFWNRRTLTKMQEKPNEENRNPREIDEDAIY